MPGPDKRQLAASVVNSRCDLDLALSANKRKYPLDAFQQFSAAVRAYAAATRREALIHRGVVNAVYDLCSSLQMERKAVPGRVLYEADRLECLLFSRYDPHFEGDEPPGL